MAQDPKTYRDPKVTTEQRGSRPMQWVWIVAAVIVVLLLLAWVFGWFTTPRTGTATGPVDAPVVTQEQPQPGEGATGGAPIGGATTGDGATGATDGADPGTDQSIVAPDTDTGADTGQATVAPDADTGEAAGETVETIDITPPGEEPELGDDVEVDTVPIQPAD